MLYNFLEYVGCLAITQAIQIKIQTINFIGCLGIIDFLEVSRLNFHCLRERPDVQLCHVNVEIKIGHD